MKVMAKLDPDRIKISPNKVSLWAINLIKEKKSGKLKGRTCADRRPQRCYITE